MEMFHEEGEAGTTFRHIGRIEVLGGLIKGSVGFSRQDVPVELFQLYEGFEDGRVKDLGTKVDVSKQSVTAFITDFAESLDREQTVGMEGTASTFEDVHHTDSPHPLGVLWGEKQQ